MKVVWSEDAVNDYHQNIEYLLEERPVRSAANFIEEVDAVIELIKKWPEIYPESDYIGIRRAVIRKQITLFYKLENTAIYLVRFWNTFQNPESFQA
ncbi:MAG: type II toxin-antitoxin system RelE/ParE family toxin [Imperialibacter sp.]|uniref:type II toxin-antitoxin system RelE/ParE family toxin n=1 Tax=Imperialibacter sp. TaxID=2038411 RepID=UPI0032EB6DE7